MQEKSSLESGKIKLGRRDEGMVICNFKRLDLYSNYRRSVIYFYTNHYHSFFLNQQFKVMQNKHQPSEWKLFAFFISLKSPPTKKRDKNVFKVKEKRVEKIFNRVLDFFRRFFPPKRKKLMMMKKNNEI